MTAPLEPLPDPDAPAEPAANRPAGPVAGAY